MVEEAARIGAGSIGEELGRIRRKADEGGEEEWSEEDWGCIKRIGGGQESRAGWRKRREWSWEDWGRERRSGAGRNGEEWSAVE